MRKKNDPLIFIVEDNPVYNKLVVSYLHSKKFNRVESFLSGEECLKRIHEKPDIIIQDYLLEGIDGLEVMMTTKKINPHIEFIILSGQDSIEVAINTLKYGAYDYIVKDQMALSKMVDKILKIIALQELIRNNKRFKYGILLFFGALVAILLVIKLMSVMFPQSV
ncbi:MAG: response regulator [Prolixibacteraceae bacterium]